MSTSYSNYAPTKYPVDNLDHERPAEAQKTPKLNLNKILLTASSTRTVVPAPQENNPQGPQAGQFVPQREHGDKNGGFRSGY